MSKQKHESLVDEFDDLHHKKGVAEHLFERKDEIVNAFETIKEERTTAEDLNRYYVSVVKRFHTFYIQGEHDEIMALFKELQLDTKTLNQ